MILGIFKKKIVKFFKCSMEVKSSWDYSLDSVQKIIPHRGDGQGCEMFIYLSVEFSICQLIG